MEGASTIWCVIWPGMSANKGNTATNPEQRAGRKTGRPSEASIESVHVGKFFTVQSKMIKRTTALPFALPDLGEAELSEIKEVLESGWITTGPKVHRFEREFADYVGAKWAVAVNSCTAAMHLSLEAVGVRPGDFVVTTPYTFAATAEVIRYFDAVPVFVDVEPDTLNMDPRCLIETIADLKRCLDEGVKPSTPGVARALHAARTPPIGIRPQAQQLRRGALKAVMPVHMAGHPCEMDVLAAIAEEHALPVIEDAAHACSASFRGRPVGGATVAGVRGPHVSLSTRPRRSPPAKAGW